MEQINLFSRIRLTYLINFLFLLTLATGAPLIGFHSQWLTGPIVNAALILAVYLIGIRGALLIGILPSTIALSVGLLPSILAPMIPFIIISNSLLVLIIDWFKRQNAHSRFVYWWGLFFAAGIKYLFLFISSGVVVHLLLKQSLALKVMQLMSWPQFFTSIIGGFLAWLVLTFRDLTSKKRQY